MRLVCMYVCMYVCLPVDSVDLSCRHSATLDFVLLVAVVECKCSLISPPNTAGSITIIIIIIVIIIIIIIITNMHFLFIENNASYACRYYTGQYFQIGEITAAAREQVGWLVDWLVRWLVIAVVGQLNIVSHTPRSQQQQQAIALFRRTIRSDLVSRETSRSILAMRPLITILIRSDPPLTKTCVRACVRACVVSRIPCACRAAVSAGTWPTLSGTPRCVCTTGVWTSPAGARTSQSGSSPTPTHPPTGKNNNPRIAAVRLSAC